ncbi:hypothetical protein KAR48_13065 [bacterium]|nr:hypothetical protein [bacterium]
MITEHHILNVPELPIPEKAIIRRIGYPAGDGVPIGPIGEILHVMQVEASLTMKFKAILHLFAIDYIEEENVNLHDTSWQIKSRHISTLLKGCHYIAVLAATIGSELEKDIVIYMEKGSATEAFILDAIGSESADSVADWVHHQAWKNLNESMNDFKETARFSPGYGDWPLSAQTDLLTQIGADEIGINLNDSLLMSPRKSVTAIFGLKKGCQDD